MLEGSANMSVVVNLESGLCATTSDLLSLPAEEEEGTWPSVFMLYVSPVCRCC